MYTSVQYLYMNIQFLITVHNFYRILYSQTGDMGTAT